jgi:flagellar M-ring protein FliF
LSGSRAEAWPERERSVNNLLASWDGLDGRRRVIVLLAAAATFAAVLGLARLASQPSLSLLYSNLDPAAAAEVMTALDQQGVTYDVRGTAIFVDNTMRDQLRLSLAGQGLPQSAARGYELLDSLSGFGTTAQMFDAAYWRAKEGELARTIASSPQVETARVHIATTPNRPFQRNTRPTASVAITPRGGALPIETARAARHLVAASVSGMSAADVAVIDARTGSIVTGDDVAGNPGASADERALILKRNVERLLSARVGAGAAVVEVNIETLAEAEQITERRFDPDTRVAISTETEERSTQSEDRRPANVTVASNLPEGDGAGGEGRSTSRDSETRNVTNFEVSETRREVVRQPGGTRRITVAVLVDGLRGTGPDGTPTWEPRPRAELDGLRDLVASAVGYDEGRGDVITIQSMQFEVPPVPEGTAATNPPFTFGPIDVMGLAQLAALTIVALILGLFVVRPLLASGAANAPPALPPPSGRSGRDLALGTDPVLTGEIDDGGGFSMPGMATVGSFDGESGTGGDDPVERLRRLIGDRQTETVGILRSWMEEGGARR